MDRIDRYLEELVAQLDCDPLRRDEIRLEVHHHLRELVSDGVASGKSEEEAVTDALQEFGASDVVAERLSAVHRGGPAPVVWKDRPHLVVIFAALAYTLLAWVPGSLQAHWGARLIGEFAFGSGQASFNAWMALSQALGTHPDGLVAICQSLAIAVVAWRYAPRRPWLWAGVGVVVVPVVALVPMALQAWRSLGLGTDPASPLMAMQLPQMVLHPVWSAAVATVALPAIGRWLSIGDLTRHRGLLLAGLLATALCAHPLLGALGPMLSRDPRLADGQFRSLLSGWSSVQWAAAMVALWLAARFGLPNPRGDGRRSLREAAYAALAGAGVGSVAAFLLGPHVRLSVAALGVCAAYALVLAAGAGLTASAILLGVRRREMAPASPPPLSEPVPVE